MRTIKRSQSSVNKLIDNIDTHSCGDVLLCFELFQLLHYLLVGSAEHFFDFVDAEGTARCVVLHILKVSDVDQLVGLTLLW